MMKTIVALLLSSSASAFKPSKAFLGIGGLASAAKYDPKIFEDASAAKDAIPIEQGERRLDDWIPCTNNCECKNDCDSLFPDDPSQASNPFYMNGRVTSCKASCDWGIPACESNNRVKAHLCGTDLDTAPENTAPEPTPALEPEQMCHPVQLAATFRDASRQLAAAETAAAAAQAILASCKESTCDDACKPGGTYTGPGDPAGCVEGYCDAYKPGGWARYRCDPANADHHYALAECEKTCGICSGSSGNSRSRTGSLSIIIPVVIAAVLLLAAVLYLVRKRRVAAATPDETPQLDTEVPVEA